MSSMVEIKDLSKRFIGEKEEIKAVNKVSFRVPEGKIFTLLGPSGCGKTTVLRCIAGLERPESGEFLLDGRLVFSNQKRIFIPPQQRDIGMVFQSYAIWPHMNVFENVAFPLRGKNMHYTKTQIKKKVEESLATVQLTGLEKRDATRVSGGQQQRLALARVLAMEPKLLLLDEPLSNLDAKLREGMRLELKQLQQRLNLTTIYVTHDQIEGLVLSDIVAVMKDGEIQQVGTPDEIYNCPANRFVADFIGSTNWVRGRVIGDRDLGGLRKVETPYGPMVCMVVGETRPGEEVSISIRPEWITIHTERPPGKEVWSAWVETVVFLGGSIECYLKLGEGILKARVNPLLGVMKGQEVFIEVHAQMCCAIPH